MHWPVSALPVVALVATMAAGVHYTSVLGEAVPRADAAIARADPDGAADEADPAPGETSAGTAIRRAGDGFFYVRAEVNGAPVRFLVDTGANIAVLTASDARRAGLRHGRRGASVETVGGRVATTMTTLDEVRIGDRAFHGMRAAVAPDGLGVSLIGQNLLSRFRSVRIEGDRLRLL